MNKDRGDLGANQNLDSFEVTNERQLLQTRVGEDIVVSVSEDLGG